MNRTIRIVFLSVMTAVMTVPSLSAQGGTPAGEELDVAQAAAGDPLSSLPESCTDDPDYAQVRAVESRQQDETWRFSVTVEHNDAGWDHYADAWVVVNPEDGTEYGRRVLAHPHDNEQPFTRSLSGISIPESVDTVLVAATCNVHGFGGCGQLVSLR